MINSQEQEIEDLKIEFSERGRSIVFWVGAGLSAPTIPAWSALRDDLVATAKSKAETMSDDDRKKMLADIRQIQETKNLWIEFGRLRNLLGGETFSTEIKRIIGRSNAEEIPQPYLDIWSLSPKGIVSLNLDLFVQRAASHHPKQSVPIAIQPNRFSQALNVFKEKRPFIAYPHGHLDEPANWAFTNSDLERVVKDESYLEWLTLLFRTTTVVFVGVTVDDTAIGSLLERVQRMGRCELTGHYWITSRNDLKTDSWANGQGIRVIRYNNPDGKHTELLNLFSKFKKTVNYEDPAKEIPIVMSSQEGMKEALPPPDELAKEPEEKIRKFLNWEALRILKNPDVKERDIEYADLLKRYGRSVHHCWYASTILNENEFLGYKLEQEVAGGAFGTVYKAHDKDGNECAIKILRPDNFQKLGFLRNFRRGVNSLRILTERKIQGIVKFSDAAEIPPTLIMEWVDGPSLAELVEAHQINDWPTRVLMASTLASILAKCHGLPERVLHRDLRPANIIIHNFYSDPDGWNVVVLDFDLSWHKGAEDHSIMHSPAFGYLAPEQRRKISGQSTRSALVDSYGFGMTMYFLCSGMNPFPDQHLNHNWEDIVNKGIGSQAFSPWISLPRRVARLIINSTREEQASRWSMAQIEGELESLNAIAGGADGTLLIDVITEELAARTEHFAGYHWSDETSTASFSYPSGLQLSLASCDSEKEIRLCIHWENRGDQEWNRIDRMLDQALPKLIETLSTNGWAVKNSRLYRGYEVKATIAKDAIKANPKAAGKILDKAFNFATSVTSF